MMPDHTIKREQVIDHTRNWIRTVVVGCNFCPFAAREVRQDSIHYHVEIGSSIAACNEALINEFARLDNEDSKKNLY